eukprot:GHVS01080404.1.p1 GENE.GHVS01080404.1~~GHVS01080404.1.p1  ORF type:complete len:625 (+),score=123.45 GHVS01080404.1:158-2032(+)
MPYHTQHNNNGQVDLQSSRGGGHYEADGGQPLPRFVLVQVLPTVQVFHMEHNSSHRLVHKAYATATGGVATQQQVNAMPVPSTSSLSDENQQPPPRVIQEFVVRSATSRLNIRSQLNIVLYNSHVYLSRSTLLPPPPHTSSLLTATAGLQPDSSNSRPTTPLLSSSAYSSSADQPPSSSCSNSSCATPPPPPPHYPPPTRATTTAGVVSSLWKQPERIAARALHLAGGLCAEYIRVKDAVNSGEPTDEFFETTFYAKVMTRNNQSGDYVEIPQCAEEISNEHLTADIAHMLRHYLKVEPNTVIKVGPSPWTMTVNPNYATKLQPADYPVFVLKKVDVASSSRNELMLHRDYNVFYDVLLGKGGNGEVFLGINRQSGMVCAFKREAPSMLYSEYHYLIRAQHVHHVTAVAYYPAQDLHDYLVLEFLAGGTIRHLLKTKYSDGLPFPFVRRYIHQVMLAVARMHSVGLVHRDLKTANLMLSQPHPFGSIKIVDFGNGHQMTRRDSRICNNLTTCFACAPEIFDWVYDQREGYSEKVDLWAAGTILYELFTGHRLFEGSRLDEVWPLVKNFSPQGLQQPMAARQVPTQAIDLLKRLLAKDPDKRISAAEALKHPYIKDLPERVVNSY